MSFLNSTQMKSLLDTLGSEYEQLIDNKSKLEGDCNKLREYIDNQIGQIKSLNADFERLGEEYNMKKRELEQKGEFIGSKDQANEEAQDQGWQMTTLSHTPPKPYGIEASAEIVDVTVITSTAFSPDGKSLAMGSNKAIRVYHINDDSFILEYTIPDIETNCHIRTLCWSSDSKKLFSGAEDNCIRIFDIDTSSRENPKQPTIVFDAGKGEVYQIAVAPNSEYYVAALGDGTIVLYDYAQHTEIHRQVRKQNTQALSISISPDSKTIAVGYSDGFIAFFDVQSMSIVNEQRAHDLPVYAITYIPNSNRLATASLDSTVCIWNVNNNQIEIWKELKEHTDVVVCLAVDPFGQWLISGSKDCTVKFTWLQSGEMCYSVKAHQNSVMTVAFAPNGRQFCTGSGDHCVKIWVLAPESELA